jgi:tetratricopeptide (TPR) repeat protein
MSERRIIGIALVAVVLVTVLVYLPALGNGFVEWDDREYVFENLGIRSIDADSLLWMFTGYHSANWHPLTWLSLAFDYSVWGLDPKGYHLTNIILHAINTLLVVIMARMLFVSATGKQQLALQFAVLVGLLFGLHPIHVESVAWVSERKDLLYGMFYLSSIVFYLKYRQANHKPSYWLCLLMFILSALSKPMAISLPLVLIALDYYPLKIIQTSWSSIFNSIRNKLPLIMVAIALALVTVYVQRKSGAMTTMQIVGFGERLLVAQWALLFYLYKTFIPVGYIFLYLIPPNVTLLNPAYSIPLAINALLLVTIFLLRNKAPLLIVSAFIYLVTLLPVLGIVQVGGQAAADRYMYLTLLVPVILFAAGIIYIKMNLLTGLPGKVIFYGVLSAVLVSFSYLTVAQVDVWRDTINLATHAIKHQPDHNHAYLKRADAHYQLGMYQEVVDDMTRVIEINTKNPTRASSPKHQDYAIRGEAHFRLGMYGEAIQDYSQAIASNSARTDYLRKRAEIYVISGQKKLAMSDYLQLLKFTPSDIWLHYKIALIQYELSMYGEAIKHLDTAILLNPNIGLFFFNRALNHEELGDIKSSESDMKRAAELGVLKVKERSS